MLTYKELQEKGICWNGYKRKKGTKPYEDGSCVKEEAENHHAIAFGRMNPITSGHESVVNKLHSVAKEHGASHNLIVSHSQDAKKNPLSSEQKVAHAKNAFHGTNVTAASKESPTILHHAAAAHAAGATHLHVVAGSDRHEEMHNLLHKYNGKDSAHGHYNFKKITVHSSGERDPDAEGTTGISASKMREHAASGNKAEFHKGAPSKMKPEHKDAMYNDVRKGMNLKEETVDQQDDRAQQLKRFKDQMTSANGPQIDTEIALDKKEKDIMTGKKKPVNKTELGLNKEAQDNLAGVNEHLTPEMGAGGYINDFIKSTNPRFNNKSKEERRKMAIGAYMAAKAKGVKEEVQIDELSTDLLAKYKTAAHASAKASDAAGNYAKGDKRFKGINKATNKQFDNDLKKHGQMKEENSHYEDSQKHLNLASKALETSDMVSHHGHMADHHDSLSQWHDSKGRSSAAQRHADKAEEHAEKYTKLARGVTEGTLQGNVAGGDAMNTTTSAPSASTVKDTTMGKKVKGFKFFGGENQPNTQLSVKEAKKEDPPFDGPYKSNFKKPNNPNRTGMDSARSLAQRAMDQVKKKSIKEAKDSHEYGYEGEMAMNQLKTLVRCAEMIEDCLKPDTDLPEWVQSKITLATDYIQTAADYLYSEMNENHIPVAPVLDRKYIKGTPENKALRAKNKPINGHPTNVKEETLDEKSDQAKQNKTMKNMMDASRGARYKLNNPVPETDHKTAQAKNVAIGRALRSEATTETSTGKVHKKDDWEGYPSTFKDKDDNKLLKGNNRAIMNRAIPPNDKLKESATGNPGGGYHGACGTADDMYADMHKHVKNLTDGDDKTVKHYLDSGHGEKLAGREQDHDHIKGDFKKFMKYYRPEMNTPKPVVKEETALIGKPVNVDKVNHAGDKPHEEKWEPAKKVSKLKKEETMKSYKEFLQTLDEKLIGGQKKLDKNHNNKLDKEDFKLLRKEETESLDEIKLADLPTRKITGKSYGANYHDPEGADETAADMKKPEKKTAGRKAGSGAGVYKPRQTMSKLKQAGATYK